MVGSYVYIPGTALTPLEPQSRSGDNPVKFQVVLSPNGTAVLKGLICCACNTLACLLKKECVCGVLFEICSNLVGCMLWDTRGSFKVYHCSIDSTTCCR